MGERERLRGHERPAAPALLRQAQLVPGVLELDARPLARRVVELPHGRQHLPFREVERRALLDAIVRQRAAVLQLLAREAQPLLRRRDSLPHLDLRLDGLDGVGALDLQFELLARQALDEDLHAADALRRRPTKKSGGPDTRRRHRPRWRCLSGWRCAFELHRDAASTPQPQQGAKP